MKLCELLPVQHARDMKQKVHSCRFLLLKTLVEIRASPPERKAKLA